MSEINESIIEAPLKQLLEEVLFFLENFIEDQNDLKIVEQQLKDYDNITGLVKIIQNVFKTLTKKVEKKIAQLKLNFNESSSFKSYKPEEEYEKLEQIIQKHEAEIRGHISLEQQLKLFNDSLQQKIEDIEKANFQQVEGLNKQILNLKKDLGKSCESYRQLIKENEQLRESVDIKTHTEGEIRMKDKKYFLQYQQFCHSDHRIKKIDYSSEYTNNTFYPSMRHSTPMKSQSQHHKSKIRNSQDSELFAKYNQLLQKQAKSLTQRSQIIQASQQLLKNNFFNNHTKLRNTLNSIQDNVPKQQQKRTKSQGNTSKPVISASTNNINNSSKNVALKISDQKAHEAIQRLLKLK